MIPTPTPTTIQHQQNEDFMNLPRIDRYRYSNAIYTLEKDAPAIQHIKNMIEGISIFKQASQAYNSHHEVLENLLIIFNACTRETSDGTNKKYQYDKMHYDLFIRCTKFEDIAQSNQTPNSEVHKTNMSNAEKVVQYIAKDPEFNIYIKNALYKINPGLDPIS